MGAFTERRKITPPQLAAQWGITPEKVLKWIVSGELRAINAATRTGMRPRWLIDMDDIADFERRRAAVPPPKPSPRRRTSSAFVRKFYF